MRFGINLRGDLAKLTDAEIASTFETLMTKRKTTYQAAPFQAGNKWLYQKGFGMPLGRGPFHAPIFYKFLGLSYASVFGSPSLYDLYLLDCELKDVRDEIERRVRRKKTAMVRS
jgi:hypothetical protein